ncbi:hypothetical protein EWH70_32775 [Amycolatopsis suaedae]|uniref:DUF7192 domain-containing protein n=2 Tax=Amycolatopsis suaedae TaxID=2510978 RepID=A0A4Q7IZL8_9PSEU|nr:hypothetical protein EWH70_32775 [Amycolatopsis suaedae]
MLSWQEFLDAVAREPVIDNGSGRAERDDDWAGAGWDEARRLAVDGWHVPLEGAGITVGLLRERAGLGAEVTMLEPHWDVTGAEVDIGAYLAGVPECMVDAVPRRTSTRGRVVTFLIPGTYSHRVPHEWIINRGLALATLCAAIIEAGHSVEIWSGWACKLGRRRVTATARVISAGEPLDVGRLIFAAAHPAMLRRLWFSVWDGWHADSATELADGTYGQPPYDCRAEDLPPEITDPYVFPFLEETDTQWTDLDVALSWCRAMFADLGLVTGESWELSRS